MGGAFCRNARTDAVEGQQTAYVNLWDPLAHGHWPGADGRFGGGEADAGDSRNGGVDDLERLRPPLAVRMRFQDNVPSEKPSQGCRSAGGSCRCERPGRGRLRPHRTEVEPRHMARIGGCIGRLCSAVWRGRKGIYRRVSCHESAGRPRMGVARPGTGECVGRLRGERARTSRGCGGASAGQGDIGARGGLDVGC